MNRIRKETEVAVIGSGVAGLVAALTLAEGGADVTVFEKKRILGGASRFIHGTFAVESGMQRKSYITYSRDQAFKNIMEYNHWRANPRLVRAIVNESASTIAWLQQVGVEFTGATTNIPEAPATYHVINGTGAAAIKVLANKASQLGASIIPEVAAKQLILKNRRIDGALVHTNGKDVQIKARAVIIASGGYANSKEMIKKYAGYDLGVNLFPFGKMGTTGDGLRMAFQTGAAEDGLGVLELLRTSEVGAESGRYLGLSAVQPDLWVNAQGERFCDESITFVDTSMGNSNARQTNGSTYTIFDNTIKLALITNGINKSMTPDLLPGSSLKDLDRELEGAVNNNKPGVYKSGSISELAKKIGVNPGVLQDTVDEYNEFCHKGHDDLFAKDRRYLRPIIDPPFYAVKAHTTCLGSLGGIKINHKTEVIDRKDKVIPGLYAAGCDAGGMYGDGYSMRESSGLASAFATNSGRIAGRNALTFIGK